MKLSFNKAKLIRFALVCGLATVLPIQQVWILKFVLGLEQFPRLSRNGPLGSI